MESSSTPSRRELPRTGALLAQVRRRFRAELQVRTNAAVARYLTRAPSTRSALENGPPVWSLHSRPGLIVFVRGLAETLSFEERTPGSNEWVLTHDAECELDYNPD
jgi:hypothetical protein